MTARNILGAIWLAALLALFVFLGYQFFVVIPRERACDAAFDRQLADVRAAVLACRTDELCQVIGADDLPPLPEACEQ